MARYSIVYRDTQDVIKNKHTPWRHFHSASSKRTLRGARKERWRWVNTEWDFAGDLPMFEIYDSKTGGLVY